MPNRLAQETSPYLLQHAANPVDWYAWGPEALERAKAEDRPILLSIGYSACHWCHVMAHESFEDAEVAAVMNRLFVNIKVDREERPDLDQIYQSAHQMIARRSGGWPLTMFLAPDGTPFFGGTYFPKDARYGLPGFPDLLERVAATWRNRRAELTEQGAQILAAFSRTLPRGSARRSGFSAAPIEGAIEALRSSFDRRFGGFGGAPKFPHPADLELCLRRWRVAGDADAGAMALTTLENMAKGGIYDQLGGGFARYSVDAFWLIPHFEKMLYDNGPLLGLCAEAWQACHDPLYARVARECAAWMLREMQSPEGGFYSSLDADSEHEEGKFYVWSREELRGLLSDAEYAVLAPHYGLDEAANFEGRHWNLHVSKPLATGAQALLESARTKLFTAREKRVRPGRDEKLLVSWNALAIKGLARAARVFGERAWLDAARRALDFIRRAMWREGRLAATCKDGRAHLKAYLDDYAFLLDAVLELMQAEFVPADLEFAEQLAGVLLEQFEDPASGGFFFTARDHEQLIHRPKPGRDNATPSGNGIAAYALQRLAALTGDARYSAAAERTLELFLPSMHEYPGGFASLQLALGEALVPPTTVVIRGDPVLARAWTRELAQEHLPHCVVLAVPAGAAGLPQTLDKPLEKPPVNAWICQGVTCLLPIDGLDALKKACERADIR
ncbi:MAG: thioredoxin domain-containing protein [Betaproteobacteria bacterium]|nr:thioredoxin domain-containing protein [Betaproteobacteria bacterium]